MTTTEPLTGRSLDAAVHKALGKQVEHDWIPYVPRIRSCRGCGAMEKDPYTMEAITVEPLHCNVPHYSTDYNACRVMEDAIEAMERDGESLFGAYLGALISVCHRERGTGRGVVFSTVRATAAQRARAFVQMAGEKA